MNKRSHHLVPYSKVDEVIKKSNRYDLFILYVPISSDSPQPVNKAAWAFLQP